MIPVAAALLLALPLQAVEHPTGTGQGKLWLGSVPVGAPPAVRPGEHLGPAFSVGGRRLQARWLADSQERTTPVLQLPELPVRRHLVIAIDHDLATRSALLPDFVDLREAEGWDVLVATSQDWDVATEGDDDSRAGRLRGWLAERYADDPGAYLLLIGDPDPDGGSVPMKNVHPLSSVIQTYDDWLADEMDPMPTDFYYADLDGVWDCDGDGRYGEYPDDADEGCVDFGPELYVGRLPVYHDDAELLDELLARAIARDLETDKSYRGKVLLPGALFSIQGAASPTGGDYQHNTDGASVLDAIHADLPTDMQARAVRMYEDDGLVTSAYDHDLSLSQDAVVELWQQGQGLVVWAGHGANDGVYRMIWTEDQDGNGDADNHEVDYPSFMHSDEANALGEAGGAFTWHISCDNGFPEDEDNLGAALLRGGAAATATASRPAFGVTPDWGEDFEPRPDLATSSTAGFYYAQQIASGVTAGEALAYTKWALPGDGWGADRFGVDYTGAAWATKVEFNLYGDPTRSLELCDADTDCNDGSPCNGTESCDQGFCVHHDPVDCGDLDSDCTRGSCEAETGTCVELPQMDGTLCDDGDWCSETDSCSAGVCGGEERSCGERAGWVAWCDSEIHQCEWEEIPIDEEPGGCACGSARGRAGVGWLVLVAGAMVARPRRRLGDGQSAAAQT